MEGEDGLPGRRSSRCDDPEVVACLAQRKQHSWRGRSMEESGWK